MVITRLIGGLGNQMFQYAVGRAISIRNGVQLKLDLTGFENYPLRQYRLNALNIDENIASYEDLERYKPSRNDLKSWMIFQVKKRFSPYRYKSVINERHGLSFDPTVLNIKHDIYLIGYWQSAEYFNSIADVIRKDFTLKNEMSNENRKIHEEISSLNAISMHIRRGDYVNNQTTSNYHGILAIDYYKAALKIIDKQVSQPVIYIFSDDIFWVRKNFKLDYPIRFMDHTHGNIDYEAIHLIAECKHHIIANSSFSWWGAWLSTYPDKIVIAPKQWLSQAELAKKKKMANIPGGWVRI